MMEEEGKGNATEGEEISDFSSLPEGVVAKILSLTTPSDACRSSAASRTFHAAAQSDIVWDKFLPTDWELLIFRPEPSNLNFDPISSPKKEIFFSLCDNPVLIDDGNKSFSLEKRSGKKCIMLGARDLSIVWGDTSNYWTWEHQTDSRFAEVAVLLEVWWLEIRGRISSKMLSPKTTYAVYFVFKMRRRNYYGFHNDPADATVGILGTENHRKIVCLDPYLDDFPPRNRMDCSGLERPQERHDGWFEIELGEFESGDGDDEVGMSLKEAVMASFCNLLRNPSCAVVACSNNGFRRSILHDLHERQRQSPYYDKICRPATDFLPLLAFGIKGVTSNPKIFERSILSSKAYDEQFRDLAKEGKDVESAYWELVTKDIRDTSAILEPIYTETAGLDGYVSVQVSPWLADNTEKTVEAAKWLHKKIGRPNVYIKIPATAESIPAIKQVISQGISVNATLIFCISTYEMVIEAYLNGLECSGLSDLSTISGAAAFYISRVDAVVDAELEKIATHQALELRGKAARAQAAIAYKIFREKFSGPRWEALAKRGAKKQRLMWASTNVKNPAYPDTSYIDLLIGPETISTIPEEALAAFMDHGTVSRTLDSNMEEAESVYKGIENLGINWKAIGSQLEDQVLDLFKKSYDTALFMTFYSIVCVDAKIEDEKIRMK